VKAAYGTHHWSFPKGHTDPGETNYIAAYREVEEETSLKKEDLKEYPFNWKMQYQVRNYQKVSFSLTLLLSLFSSTSSLYLKVVELWLAELINKDAVVKIDPNESEDYTWASFEEACKLMEHETTKEVLRAANVAIKDTFASKNN